MRLRNLIPVFLGVALLAGVSSGCVIRGRTHAYGTVAYSHHSAPPAPRYHYVEARPGWVWIDGYWAWNGYDWAWNDGYWERHRPGYAYVQGTWYSSGGRHHWRPGHWKHVGNSYQYQHGHSHGGVHVREHRGSNTPVRVHRTGGNQGVRVREHGGHRNDKTYKVKVKDKKGGTVKVKVREH
jgi:hypothetical protein